MGVKIVKKTNNIPKLTQALKKLGKKSIKVGVFGEDNYKYGDDADLVTIAYVHEFGTTITPKKGKYLTIPVHRSAKNKRAGDFPDLFFVPTDNGNGLLARNKGKDQLEVLFVLVKSVTIPERAFLRTGFDANINAIANRMETLLNDVLDLNVNPDAFLDGIGMEFAGLIQKHMKGINSPPNAAATVAAKGSSNPLQDTGRLIGSIRHEIE
ncbi:hypothetical protein NYE67_20480 [Solibacillus sp. FSL W8-0474]|uniref:hypothetical protein n=1 Tax=Solibacillus sp. FSL W8-0474 TaxID=2975336 RepID=UPI0030F678A2